MSRLTLTLSLLTALALFAVLGISDQRVEAQSIPSGSYQKTCKNIMLDANGLHATCQKMDGTWIKTGLSTANFPCSEIENEDGNLVCTSAD